MPVIVSTPYFITPGGGGLSWNIASASYDGVAFSVAGQAVDVGGLAFKDDGSKMYIIGHSFPTNPANANVYQYTLSTAWDLSSASYDSVSFNVGGQEATPLAIAFKSDGTKMYIVGDGNDTVYQYSLSTAWDMSTASYDSVSFNVSGQVSSSTEVAFKTDGTKMYVLNHSTSIVHQYTLGTAWDLTTASYDSISHTFIEASQGTALAFTTDGTKMFFLGLDDDTVYQYTLSTPWNVSSAVYDSVSFGVGGQDTSPRGVAFRSDNGTKMYVAGDANDATYQYSL